MHIPCCETVDGVEHICFRVNGIYIKEEWTSIGDVGKCFDGKCFTLDEYIATENNYVIFVDRIIQMTKTDLFKITGLEDDSHNCQYENGHILRKEEVSSVVRGCLREEYWCRLVASSLEVLVMTIMYMQSVH